ncbi:MAG: molybdopterin-synthase adenylyltransferase MoeB [Lentisphaeria bacterium]|nr:molybdopterin-synthase adenylyltransferase MoeB [Lentisphaeria bacterium]NQZ70254.1 molybdopterin-synthase adenylyltransferase MoeB [Lentisphaeria bacterium]
MALSQDELLRYQRHLTLADVGLAGQEKLKAARVLLIGAGGLGSPAALYLASVGIGTLGIVDFDTVDLSNLQRQILYTHDDVGKSKAETAKKHLEAMNPFITIQIHDERFSAENAEAIMSGYDILLDGTDNFSTRYLVNDACVLLGKINVYGSIFQFEGQISVFGDPDGPCYRCLYPEAPEAGSIPNCAEAGVLGILPGTVGVIQATEAVKLILGIGKSLVGRIILYDALQMTFRELKLKKDPACPVCGTNPSITKLEELDISCELKEEEDMSIEITPTDLNKILDSENLQIVDVREDWEHQLCKLPDTTDSLFIPLGELVQRVDELNADKDLVIYCRSGMRSLNATEYLLANGFKSVKNMTGGIHQWSDEIDPSIPKY